MTRKITITDNPNKFVLTVNGHQIAEVPSAKSLAEGSYDPVLYFDPAHFDSALFSKSDHSTHCPFKGDANYYDLTVDGKTYPNAAWYYENPMPAAAGIKGLLGFYPVVAVSPA
ncbi:MAG: DUF427 domain-containing protein [Pseudomonadota bacterium]